LNAAFIRLCRRNPPHAVVDHRQVLAVARSATVRPGPQWLRPAAASPVARTDRRLRDGRQAAAPAGRDRARPVGGARFIAGPVSVSGTAAGGTGGGRSENIWAATDPGTEPARIVASAINGKGRLARPHPLIPLPVEPIGMLFTENAANSSLRRNVPIPRAFWNVAEPAVLIQLSRSVHNRCPGDIRRA
jgi:hypothetical protein